MATAAIADFDARITVFDSEFPDRRVRARGGRSRHVPGQCHALRILSRSVEVLSRERKATLGRCHALRILSRSVEVLSRERKATLGQ
jgi:hypothetical protein